MWVEQSWMSESFEQTSILDSKKVDNSGTRLSHWMQAQQANTFLDAASQVDKCVTNTAKNTIPAEVDMVAPTTSSASARRMNTVPEGRLLHNGKVLDRKFNGVTLREMNQLAETGNVYSPNNLFTSVFFSPHIWSIASTCSA